VLCVRYLTFPETLVRMLRSEMTPCDNGNRRTFWESNGHITGGMRCRERRSIFLSGRSLQQSDANHTSVEVYVAVSSTFKHQRCRSLCFRKFVSRHPICKIKAHLRPESFLAIREYASYYRLPLLRRVVGRQIEFETLPYLNFRLHLNSLSATTRVV